MHAEYKVPGGKLVVIDLDVKDHMIEQARLSGDFFLEPPEALSLINQALQGRGDDAWDTLGRFLINTTVGVGGLFDPASADQVPKRSEDFGQTLGVWGWQDSRYVELPPLKSLFVPMLFLT